MARAFLVFIGLTFIVFGVWLLLDPEVLTRLIGLKMETVSARTEIRAFYGGLELGIGVFLLGCAMFRNGLKSGLGLVACTLGGAGVARLVSLVQDGREGWQMALITVLEIGATLLALILLVRKPDKPGSTPRS